MKNILLILLLAFSVSAKSATYYVVPPSHSYVGMAQGSDVANGSFANPWATWQKGFETAEAGDTVYFRGGVWFPTATTREATVVFINPYGSEYGTPVPPYTGHDGTAENPICMFAYPGETPILDCRNVAVPSNYLTGIGLNRANYWNIRGLTITNVLQSQESTVFGFITGACSNMTVEDLTVSHIGGKGISNYNYFKHEYYPEQSTFSGDTTRYLNCDASYCMDSIGRNVGSTDFGNWSDGFWINVQNTVSYVIIDGCRSWMNSDDGFDLPTTGVILMNYCLAFNNGHLEWGGGQGIRLDPSVNMNSMPWIFRNNISCYNSNGFNMAPRVSVERSAFLYNNLSINNEYGIIVYGSDTITEGRGNRIFKNNIFYKNTTFDLLLNIPPVSYSNNYWGDNIELNEKDMTIPDHSPTVIITDADFQSLDTTQLSAARHSDGSLPDITFGRLAEGSDAIGAGIDVGMSAEPNMGIDWDWLDNGSPPPTPSTGRKVTIGSNGRVMVSGNGHIIYTL